MIRYYAVFRYQFWPWEYSAVKILSISFPKEFCQLLVNWCSVFYFSDIDPQWLEKWKSKKIMKEELSSSLSFVISSSQVSILFNPFLGKNKLNVPVQWNFMIFPGLYTGWVYPDILKQLLSASDFCDNWWPGSSSCNSLYSRSGIEPRTPFSWRK